MSLTTAVKPVFASRMRLARVGATSSWDLKADGGLGRRRRTVSTNKYGTKYNRLGLLSGQEG